jgi:ABC-type Fe3+ transport system permease subunit
MFNRRFVLTACVVAMAALVTAASTQAWSPLTRVNHLTFSGPVALPGVVLAAGAYTFESGPAGTNPDIVRVTSRNGQRLLFTGFTMRIARPAGSNRVVSMGEAAAGEPTPIAAWYPIGMDTGHEFLYR